MVAAACLCRRVAEALLKSFPRGAAVSFRTLAGDVQLRRHVDAWGMEALGWGAGGPRAVWEREGCMGGCMGANSHTEATFGLYGLYEWEREKKSEAPYFI